MFEFKPVWFDSLGAKSSCVWIRTSDISIIIDPGIAVMQPSYPASWIKKLYWLEKGEKIIKQRCKKADIIIITHYHYDHYFPDDLKIYRKKTLLIKNPNEWINDSQRKRAEEFFDNLFKLFGGLSLKQSFLSPRKKYFPDPLNSLNLMKKTNFGEYKKRRDILLKKGKKWFKERVKNWSTYPRIPEKNFDNLKIKFIDSKTFKFGNTTIKFTSPLFHGVEFSRVGWVVGVVIRYKRKKLLYSSDVNGPVIEDYANWIIKENPNFLVLDGPPTYLIPYMMNMINLKRCVKNLCNIIKNIDAETIILDHHLLREKNYRKRLKQVYTVAKKEKKEVLTAAEFLGKKPVIDYLSSGF